MDEITAASPTSSGKPNLARMAPVSLRNPRTIASGHSYCQRIFLIKTNSRTPCRRFRQGLQLETSMPSPRIRALI